MKTIQGQPIGMDGANYSDTVFKQCEMIYTGQSGGNFTNCQFDACRWTFQGPALATMRFLKMIYGQGPEGQQMIESAFAQIRGSATISGVTLQ